MDAQTWNKLEQMFDEATALPARERAAFCAAASAGDPALHDELLTLLQAHDIGESVLDAPPEVLAQGASAPELVAPGTRLGVWSVGAPIRRGGSGEVYFATRADGAFDQRVAVKLLYREAAPDVQRFHAERQILAGLDHPGIARLLDGGVSASGRLYAVVEYVDGEPLTEHCQRRHAGLGERLALFLQVCDVVAYAHRSLIVHRDLKPGNILVTPEQRVKLLDFGVAKRLDQASAGDDPKTSAPYTSDYAAPEQLTGQAITTATDVYALGVLLFELLAGERPWNSDGLPIARIVQLIVHDEAPLASAVAAQSAAPAVAARLLEGDLDAIVATCLRKDAGDRYPTVDALARDIGRHLGNEPVAARGRSRSYVLGRALKRHRWSVAAGALLFVTLAGGLAATAWQARRAEIERDVARRSATREEAVRYYLTAMFRSSIAKDRSAASPASGPMTAKTMLDRSAQRVLQQYRDDPQLAGKVVITLSDLYGALEDVEGQAPLLEGFLAAAGPEADAESVALARQKLAHIELLRGNLPRAAELLPQAEAFWATAPGRYHEQHLESLFVRAMLQRNQGDLAGSIATYRSAIAERSLLSGETHRETANLYNSLAITLTAANRLDEALAAYRTTLAIHDKLGQGEDLDALVILGNTGTLAFRMGKLREAEQILKTAYEKQRERAGDSAAVAASMSLYGAALDAAGRHGEAIAILELAVAMAVKFAGATSPLAIQGRLFLADALTASGEFVRAGAVAAENRTISLQRFGEAGLLTLRVRIGEARLRLAAGGPAAAAAEFEALVGPLKKAAKPGQPLLAHALLGQGDALLALDRPADAVPPLREAVALREQLLWAESWELALARARLGEALKRSRSPGAGALLEQGAATLAAQLGPDHPQVLRVRRAIAFPG